MSESSPAPGSGEPSPDAQLAELWEQVRKKFATSTMVEIKLTSLAQNAETEDWPLPGDDETPSKYIDFSYDELKMLPEFAPEPSRIALLIDILHETLAFDDPFGDMAEQIEETTAAGDMTVRKVLKELEIPEDYPIALTNLDDEAKELCSSEGIENVGQFADFAQGMAQSVVIGGDFRTFLNAMTQKDEEEIANFLPFRPKSTGLYVPEAFGMVIRRLSGDEKFSLLKQYGKKFSAEEERKHSALSREAVNRLEAKLYNKMDPILAYFTDEKTKLAGMAQSGEGLERYFLVLNDPDAEEIAIHILRMVLHVKGTRAPVAEKKKGFFGRLFRKG